MPIFFAKDHETEFNFISPEFQYQHITPVNTDSISVVARPESPLKACLCECLVLMVQENKNIWLLHDGKTYRLAPDKIVTIIISYCKVQ